MKNIIFLGAGASKADGAPLQNELFKEYFALRMKKRQEGNILYDDFIDDFTPMDIRVEIKVKEFFKDFFGINNFENHYNYPTFEEALGMLDLAINRKEHFLQLFETYNLSSLKQDNYQSSRLALILAMTETIDFLLGNSKGTMHSILLSNLQKRNDFAFISTNYDILIDNSILKNQKKSTMDLIIITIQKATQFFYLKFMARSTGYIVPFVKK